MALGTVTSPNPAAVPSGEGTLNFTHAVLRVAKDEARFVTPGCGDESYVFGSISEDSTAGKDEAILERLELEGNASSVVSHSDLHYFTCTLFRLRSWTRVRFLRSGTAIHQVLAYL